MTSFEFDSFFHFIQFTIGISHGLEQSVENWFNECEDPGAHEVAKKALSHFLGDILDQCLDELGVSDTTSANGSARKGSASSSTSYMHTPHGSGIGGGRGSGIGSGNGPAHSTAATTNGHSNMHLSHDGRTTAAGGAPVAHPIPVQPQVQPEIEPFVKGEIYMKCKLQTPESYVVRRCAQNRESILKKCRVRTPQSQIFDECSDKGPLPPKYVSPIVEKCFKVEASLSHDEDPSPYDNADAKEAAITPVEEMKDKCSGWLCRIKNVWTKLKKVAGKVEKFFRRKPKNDKDKEKKNGKDDKEADAKDETKHKEHNEDKHDDVKHKDDMNGPNDKNRKHSRASDHEKKKPTN